MDSTSAGTYTSLSASEVRDLNNPLAEVKDLPAGTPVAIGGSFVCNGNTYYRPTFAVSSNTWYGIRESVLVAPPHKLTTGERSLVVIGSLIGLLKRKKSVKA
jgi:hypothetical protein